MELDCDEEKASKVTSVGCVSTILAYRFEVSKEVDDSSHCPYIAVAPASSATPTVNIVWGGKEDFKKTSAIEQHGVQLVISINNFSVGLGADFTPEPDSQPANQLLIDELLFAAALIHEEVEKGCSVAIHCQNGCTRSPTVIAVYLMMYQKMSWEVVKQRLDSKMSTCQQGRAN